eukprot:m.30488 g.30488  ORF g.30488 m.30488 type:complete len:448 (-) comp16294_c0_seq1:576-1919(-)
MAALLKRSVIGASSLARFAVSSTANQLATANQQKRHLNIHEHYSHQLMRKYGIRTPEGGVGETPAQIQEIAEKFDAGGGCVVKAQVLAGGRGKGHFNNGFKGGVHVVDDSKQAVSIATEMLGNQLITMQTGAEGRPCNSVMVVEKLKIQHEYYFAILMDREHMGPIVVASSEGGMDIETVAANTPDLIIKTPIDITIGMTTEIARDIAQKINITPPAIDEAVDQFMRLYDLFLSQDATMLEINPLVTDTDDGVLCLDAKFGFDDNAEYRQKSVFGLRDVTQESALEVEAHKSDLNYIQLDGTIGCLVNGAGLAMATLDIIQLYGGTPANFLDVGGGATAEQVEAAFKLIISDTDVNCIFVNIFGGIMRCDVIADGVLRAAAKLDLKIPVVVRLQGTMVDEAKALIASSDLDIVSCDDLDDAALKAVKISEMMEIAKEAGLSINVRNL